MPLKIPPSLLQTDLKTLTFKCGLLHSGTKPILTSRLLAAISSVRPTPPPRTRILSIDMGIRNLAYCLLDVTATPVQIREAGTVGKGTKEEIPKILEWRRIGVSAVPVMEAVDSKGLVLKEAFDPETLARAAYKLLRERLLKRDPTHVLIERQRFRSGSSKHILEWTIRVNMLESILYGVLCTLKAEGLWGGEVVGVLPGKVGPFWVGDEEGVEVKDDGSGEWHRKERNGKSAKIRNKGLKIDLVRRWLAAGDVVGLSNEESVETARQYMERWDRPRGARKGGMKDDANVARRLVDEEMGKLDDLADCLLQGMAWVRWEENKRIALKYGVEALLD